MPETSDNSWRSRIARLRQRAPLPVRVATRVRMQEADSEILVGWIQLAVVIGFSIVYLIAPKTFRADAPFQPVPWALGIYLGFTVLRLFLAYRHRLPGVASLSVDRRST